MDCTICSRPIDEHGEGRSTDRCIAKKLGWTRISLQGTFGNKHWQAWDKEDNVVDLPFYSSPEMSAATWGLFRDISLQRPASISFHVEIGWILDVGINDAFRIQTGHSETLAICRAFLRLEVLK